MPGEVNCRSGNANVETARLSSAPAIAGSACCAICRPQLSRCFFFYRYCRRECNTCTVLAQKENKGLSLPAVKAWHGYCDC